MTTQLRTIALLLVTFAFTTAAAAVEPGELACYDSTGQTTVRSIDAAKATGGGILVHEMFAAGLTFVTQPCIANLGARPALATSSRDEVVIHCTDPAGSVVYHAPARSWAVSAGVLTWREVRPSNEQLVSTLPCLVFNVGDGLEPSK